MLKESNKWVQEVGIQEIVGVISNKILVENIDETNFPLPFVKPFGMTSGASVRGTVGLILVRIVFNCFNFYSIDTVQSNFNPFPFQDASVDPHRGKGSQKRVCINSEPCNQIYVLLTKLV